ncbi:DNA primase [Enterococcus sp. BWB1-3]|uniref:DNA primase n=1 Tax=unclassified Enterococcus TaxID=2608891 RepID=UPI001921C256|nr:MULTISPECIES: DNA primase [unclassified Enterococcus]MBL1229576.1 DNA primase [Enterococcus sp. BWB1-3]MCB5950733.1 DNA primase [Enterococcus sp. BWT-B8]
MAQRIPQEVIDEVRQRTNIVEIVGQYVQLKKSGKSYMGLCPFHEERSPSFSVAEDKQIYHCFGCGKGGSVFNFIQEIEGVSFPEAVQKIADMEQIPLQIDLSEHIEGNVQDRDPQRRQLLELHTKAAALYHHVLLNTQIGEPALNYLLERGLTKEIIEEFQIGFAPQKRDFLSQVFSNEKISDSLFQETGLFIQRESGEFLDRFYQRIMFPISDAKGKIIAFSGRLLQTEDFSGEDMPKYLNSPETKLFNKRETLFNFNLARKEIRKENTVFLFEGFMDVIAAWQSGIKSGVASMGTSLTNEQIRQLERAAGELVLCYDGDKAGIEATNRAVSLLSEHSRFQLSIVNIPEKLDPDDYLRKYGPEAFKELALHGRETVVSFKMRYHKLTRNMNNEKEQLDYVNTMLMELSSVDSPLEKDRYLNQLAEEFHLSIHSLEEQLRLIEAEKRHSSREKRQQQSAQNFDESFPIMDETAAPAPTKKKLSRVEKAERMLLYRIMNEGNIRAALQQNEAFSFVHTSYQELYLLIDSFLSTYPEFVLAQFLEYLQQEELRNLVIDISYQELSEEGSERELEDLLKVIENSVIDLEIQQKNFEKQEALHMGNRTRVDELSLELIKLAQKRQKTR